MKCQVCNRDFGTTLSICPACGAMMNDTVREELAPKVTPSGELRPVAPMVVSAPLVDKNPYRVPPPATKVEPPKPPPRKPVTAKLAAPKTSQTLVGFQPKNSPLPEWRLQMQNAVRTRRGGAVAAVAVAPVSLSTNGSAALKIEPEIPQIEIDNDSKLGKALKRIAESRESFASPGPEKKSKQIHKPSPPLQKAFPFGVVEPIENAPATRPDPVAVPMPKPTLVARPKVDTNKLPKIQLPAIQPEAERVEDVEKPVETESMIIKSTGDLDRSKRIFIAADVKAEIAQDPEVEEDEIEDLAPVSMRFNAGLFDLIICTLATMITLSPLAFSTTEWFSLAAALIAAAVFGLVTFVYLTASVGLYGRTLGMKIFGLEIVDAEENEYPTLSQAAVNSALFLGSLVTLGAGFVVMLFNEERRAFHDLMSGTIVVRQF